MKQICSFLSFLWKQTANPIQIILLSSETYTIKKNSLVLMSITSSDDGKYKCTASNEKTGEIIDLKEYTLKNYASSGLAKISQSRLV